MPKTASQFIVAAPTERAGEFTAVKERFSVYLSAHFPAYDFIIVDSAPIESDDFQVYPILGKAGDTSDPDGGIEMVAPPEPYVVDEIRKACRQFDASGRRLS